jgi:hypothetical protein
MTADPSGYHDDKKSELGEANHLSSLSGAPQVVRAQLDRVFGHYAIQHSANFDLTMLSRKLATERRQSDVSGRD